MGSPSKIKGVKGRIESSMGPLYIVRLYDYYDCYWIDVSGPLSLEAAEEEWDKLTNGGTRMACYGDRDYYKVFPYKSRMIYNSPIK